MRQVWKAVANWHDVRRSDFTLVPKLQLGNAPVCEAPASSAVVPGCGSIRDRDIPKLELGNEENDPKLSASRSRSLQRMLGVIL
ncbi:hypothetical protein CfE428DRAFT_5574 [Chthoniobacter flavus Ellin428]|uniref:Uncharacterized protein n=1 Tax=Chthoniobacter flavus Ellin428 TaxID=497964 RepID=B4D9I4_9BACT|nr:hypothetical protein CfE428DRAFT_5574 [Chthoniobacter flavus Ellin428]TCO87822.1 hypothetical protein EV701_120121 [Chthoniobacter flavus]